MFSETRPNHNGIIFDLACIKINAREIFCLAPLAVLVMIVGVWPMPVMNLMNASLLRLVDLVKAVI